MPRQFECNVSCNVNFIRGPVHSLYPPVRLSTDRPAILDDASSSYHTKILFAYFPETSLIIALLPRHARSRAATLLLALWPLFVAAREALVQWEYLTLGWALWHATLPNDAGYNVPLVDVMRVGAVGGAMIQAVSLGIYVLIPVLMRVVYRQPQWQEPKPVQGQHGNAQGGEFSRPAVKNTTLVQHFILVIFMAPTEMAGAAMAGAWGTLLLKHSVANASGLMDYTHAVRAAVVGAAILWVPQALWYLLNVYFVWRDSVKAEAQAAHPDAGAVEKAMPQCAESKPSVSKDMVVYEI
ncbi:hypothetical protein VTO73DRAFT_9085 [Trametes versicolor]